MRLPRRLLAPLLAVVALALLAAACGDADSTSTDATGNADGTGTSQDPDDGAGDAIALDGRQFWSTSVIEDGEERTLVEGTRISLRFGDGGVSASAGCNSLGGDYSIEGSTLVVGPMGMTEIGCDPERHAQDDFVAALLAASPGITLDGDDLTLTTDTVTATFLDREVADPDRPVVGTRWEVTGFIQGDVATSMAVDEVGWFEFADDSTMTGFDGCAAFGGPVEVSDGSIGGPVEGDGEIQFGPIATDDGRPDDCNDDYADAVQELFATGDASFTIDGPNMTILNRDANGVTLRAVE